jgi:hypothetical protein
MFVGLYCSALSLSEDIRLRQSTRKSTVEQSKLLDSIGTAHMEKGYTKKVLKIVKDQSYKLEEQTGIESSLTEDDMKEYLEVLNEIKIIKK